MGVKVTRKVKTIKQKFFRKDHRTNIIDANFVPEQLLICHYLHKTKLNQSKVFISRVPWHQLLDIFLTSFHKIPDIMSANLQIISLTNLTILF